MGILKLTKAPVDGEPSELAWEGEFDLSSAGNSDPIIIPDGINKISVTLVPSGGATAKVQTSTDKVNDLEQGDSGLTWIDWYAGIVSVATQDVAEPVSGMRFVQVGSGAVLLKVRCQ